MLFINKISIFANNLIIVKTIQNLIQMELTEIQKQSWEELGGSTNATNQIRQTAYNFYYQYSQHLKQAHSFINTQANIQNLMLIAYFISQKSQIVYNMQGEQIKNIALSLNQLAKKNSDYKQLLYHLKQMIRIITMPENAKHVEDQINSFMKYFSFVMTFYNKLVSTFDKIIFRSSLTKYQWESIGGQAFYNQKMKNLLWLIFINFRKQIFNSHMDTIDNTCLLACMFTFLVQQKYREDKICSVYSNQIVQQGTFPNQKNQIQEVFLKYFILHDIGSFKKVQNQFCLYITRNNVKIDVQQLFSVRKVQINCKLLHNHYQKSMNHSQIDERLCLKSRNSSNNLRFTEWGAKRKINKFQTNAIHSKRALNFDNQYTQANENDKTINKNDQYKSNGSILKNITKNMTNTPLLAFGNKYGQSPFTKFQHTCNWVHKKCLKYQFCNSNQYKFFNQCLNQILQIGVKKDERQLTNQQILQKKQMIFGLYKQILSLFQDVQINEAIALILALQTVYFVLNITNRDTSILVQSLGIQWFQFWKGLDLFMNYDQTIPGQLKTHLLMLETSIVSYFIWKETKFISSLTELSSQKYPIVRRFQTRVLHHIAYQLHFLCKELQIPFQSSLMDESFVVCQNFYKQHMDQQTVVNIDQILLCSIYSVCRARNTEIKFKKIMLEYKKINSMDQTLFEQMIDQVLIGDKIATIIEFYNYVFVSKAKPLLLKIKNGGLQMSQLSNSQNYILSPKKILPTLQNQLVTTPSMTPTNSMLLAYNQSPLLKRKQQKKINFTDLKSKQNDIHNTNTMIKSKSQYGNLDSFKKNDNMNQMLAKKFGKPLNFNQNSTNKS